MGDVRITTLAEDDWELGKLHVTLAHCPSWFGENCPFAVLREGVKGLLCKKISAISTGQKVVAVITGWP